MIGDFRKEVKRIDTVPNLIAASVPPAKRDHVMKHLPYLLAEKSHVSTFQGRKYSLVERVQLLAFLSESVSSLWLEGRFDARRGLSVLTDEMLVMSTAEATPSASKRSEWLQIEGTFSDKIQREFLSRILRVLLGTPPGTGLEEIGIPEPAAAGGLEETTRDLKQLGQEA